MRRCHVTSFRSTQGFAVDRHHHATLPSGGVTDQQPRPDHRGQFVGVEGLEDSADRGFRRYSTPRAQQPRRGQEIAANISGPLGDRDQAARTGTHRRCSDGKNPGQVVAATTTSPRVSDGGEHAQQPLAADRHGEG